jgi:hypothetical protein
MTSTVESIAREIQSVFPATRSLSQFPLVSSSMGDEPTWVAESFLDKTDWPLIDTSWLDDAPNGLGSALSFLSNEAVCFYIPAYLLADLRGQLSRSDPFISLTRGFDISSHNQRLVKHKDYTWTDYGRERWANLTPEQALAVVHYLEWRAQNDHFSRQDITHALHCYWYERAALVETPHPSRKR